MRLPKISLNRISITFVSVSIVLLLGACGAGIATNNQPVPGPTEPAEYYTHDHIAYEVDSIATSVKILANSQLSTFIYFSPDSVETQYLNSQTVLNSGNTLDWSEINSGIKVVKDAGKSSTTSVQDSAGNTIGRGQVFSAGVGLVFNKQVANLSNMYLAFDRNLETASVPLKTNFAKYTKEKGYSFKTTASIGYTTHSFENEVGTIVDSFRMRMHTKSDGDTYHVQFDNISIDGVNVVIPQELSGYQALDHHLRFTFGQGDAAAQDKIALRVHFFEPKSVNRYNTLVAAGLYRLKMIPDCTCQYWGVYVMEAQSE